MRSEQYESIVFHDQVSRARDVDKSILGPAPLVKMKVSCSRPVGSRVGWWCQYHS